MIAGTGPEGGPKPSSTDDSVPREALDLRQFADDWVSLWQSELVAIARDREAQETWQTLLALWAGAAASVLHAKASGPHHAGDGAHDGTAGRAGAKPTPGPAPAAASSDTRDAEIERLSRQVATLESRLAGLERGYRSRVAREPRRRKR